ncbi:MAG: organic hydroperoxide resistance protein [Gammaproteobacteria bacterium]|nr:organic hydroperoxide resistance protein [Gammaproteobacteria bacterium]
MNKLQSVLYTADVTSTGGRQGSAQSDDNNLDVKLSTPVGLGGLGGEGTNPEQLFGAGYAACFIGAMQVVAGKMSIKLPADTSVNAKVSIGPIENGFGIAAQLNISLGDMDKTQAQALVDAAHQVCPYSNATRGNIEVTIKLL